MHARARTVLEGDPNSFFTEDVARKMVGQKFPMNLPDGSTSRGRVLEAQLSEDRRQIVLEILFDMPAEMLRG